LLLDIFLLNMLHHFAAVQEVGFQAMRYSQRDFDELIVNHVLRKSPTRQNHMSAMKMKAFHTANEQGQDRAGDTAWRLSLASSFPIQLKENELSGEAEAQNENRVRETKKRLPKLDRQI
jgi:hypothetical protein